MHKKPPQKEMPKFNYHLTTPKHRQFGFIASDDDLFLNHVDSFDEFYEALGYSKDLAEAGVMPEEFVWDRYRRSDSPMSLHCLQCRITSYLYSHSAKFRELYGSEFIEMAGQYMSDNINNDIDRCEDCPMHP